MAEIMIRFMTIVRLTFGLALALTFLPGWAADYPAPKEGDWIVRDFRFHTGETLPELRIHYTRPSAHPRASRC